MKDLEPLQWAKAEKILATDSRLVGEAYWNTPLKKKYDVLLAVIFTSPALVTTLAGGAWIWLDDRHWPYITLERYHPKYGVIYQRKVRSMYPNADKDFEKVAQGRTLREVKIHDDPRITRAGASLRKTGLDETPQVFDVLEGRYSFVGARPLSKREINEEIEPNEKYDPYGQFMDYLRAGYPYGATSLASFMGRQELTLEDRLELDNLYAAKGSAIADVRIAFATLRTPLQMAGK